MPGCPPSYSCNQVLLSVERILIESEPAATEQESSGNCIITPPIGTSHCNVSGIGCSSRLPYYMDTYGFHSIHGRATAISTGIKVANPTLTVWQACGDGDALAIGGNHFIHAIRRNIDINIMLFNNQIYGLTKGQYSPTSKFGAITKTSPYGTVEHPFNPGSLVLGAKGTFFARSLDVELKLNEEIMTAAALHDGCSVVEFLTNCVIFNDGAHKSLSDPALRAEVRAVLDELTEYREPDGFLLPGFPVRSGPCAVPP